MIFLTIGDLVSPSGSVYGDPMLIFPIIGNLVSLSSPLFSGQRGGLTRPLGPKDPSVLGC
jgi:hypothetical protein